LLLCHTAYTVVSGRVPKIWVMLELRPLGVEDVADLLETRPHVLAALNLVRSRSKRYERTTYGDTPDNGFSRPAFQGHSRSS